MMPAEIFSAGIFFVAMYGKVWYNYRKMKL